VGNSPGATESIALVDIGYNAVRCVLARLVPLERLGIHEIRILSGDDEGRLGAEAALRACPIERGMVVDLGGGSLQVTPVEASLIRPSQSAAGL
jgi:exopolyphosphatase/pppGpp-phosphohydrolase